MAKKKITFKVLTSKDEKQIEQELDKISKLGTEVKPELTTRLRYTITSVNGDETQAIINTFVNNLLARDSLFLRSKIKNSTPDIEMKQEVEIEGESVTVDIPMTVNFFWPKA